MIVRKVQPLYPALAQKMGIKGSVNLEVVVEPDGNGEICECEGWASSFGRCRAKCDSTVEMATCRP